MTDENQQLASAEPTRISSEPPPEYDLSVFSYRYAILATATAKADPERPVSVTLYHWCSPTVCLKTTVILPPSALSTIKGFTSLGTFFVPENLDIPETFPEFVTADSPSDQDPEPWSIARLIAQLDVTPDRARRFLQFFSFPVFGNSPDLAFSDMLLPVWKWVKPDGAYRKNGFWEAELSGALEDGRWNGGNDLVVLMGGVPEQTKRTIASSELGWKFTSLHRAELISSKGGDI